MRRRQGHRVPAARGGGEGGGDLTRQLPQIHDILRAEALDVVRESELLIVTQKRRVFAELVQGLPPDFPVLDLVRLVPERVQTDVFTTP